MTWRIRARIVASIVVYLVFLASAIRLGLSGQTFRDDMMLLCDSPSAVPTCFHDGRDNATTLDCVMAHYLCRLRSHHARAALSALPGADRSSKATILRYATRQAGLTECALVDVFDLP